jgi:acetylornithine/N-succinyldiaminopimelate aminotransferase
MDSMNTKTIAAEGLDSYPLMRTYGIPPVQFVRGSGTELFDREGKRYLDFLCGLAVTSLGHSHPAVADAIAEQARTLLHVSNLFETAPGLEVASTINRLQGGRGQVFFCNSGAESIEGAIKLARKNGGDGRHVVVSALKSFHGRTLATLHATGKLEMHGAFQPLPDGFRHVPYNDIEALEGALDSSCAAVLLEVVQGEGGVNVADAEYLAEVRSLCDKHNLLMMIDEVQTGLGRTGKWFGWQHYFDPEGDVRPDVVTMAKALGNGVPIGAIWAKKEVAFEAGEHATTFGGQPLAASAARAVLRTMEAIDAPELAKSAGDELMGKLLTVPNVLDTRGLGLLIAAEIDTAAIGKSAGEVALSCLEAGLVVNGVTASALRLAPPLNVSPEHIDEAIQILTNVLGGE